MSMKLTANAMDVKVGNPLRKLVLLKLCDNANDKGECWPSMQHIADQCEISRRSVINHVGALVDMGFLRVVNRARKGEKISNLYAIDLCPKPEGGGAGDSLGGSAGDALGGAGDSLGGSAGDSHRTSHSLEPVTEPKKNVQKKASQSRRGCRLPVDWVLPDDWRSDAERIDPRLVPRLDAIAAEFRDYWISVPGRQGVKLNWRATWRNRLRQLAERMPRQRGPCAPPGAGAWRQPPGRGDLRNRPLAEDLTDRSWAGRPSGNYSGGQSHG